MPRIEPQSAHDQEIQELFAQYAPGVALSAVSKQISPRPAPKPEHGNNQYYCFVDLEKGEDVDAAIEALDGKQGSWGGNLKVNRARNSDRKVVKEQGLLNQEKRILPERSWRRASAPTEE
jgi:RNA recognition motif-containing protein